MALPIAAEIDGWLGVEREVRDAVHLLTVRHPAAIFAPRHLLGVAQQVVVCPASLRSTLSSALNV